MSALKPSLAVLAAAIALAVGAGPALADGGHGWRHKGHGHHRHHHDRYYEPHRDVVVIERRAAPRVVYVEPRPRVIYVEPPRVHARPEINIVFPLRF